MGCKIFSREREKVAKGGLPTNTKDGRKWIPFMVTFTSLM